MNRRDFLKSTAALATVAVAGKAIGKAVEPEPPIADWSEATRRLAKSGNCFDREEFERAVQKENERLMKSPYFSPPYVAWIEPIRNSAEWPPWRDK